MFVIVGMALILGFSLASLTYVYLFRGQVRHASFDEYVRKGWPIFTPFNCLLYLFTERRARRPVMNPDDFPELATITANWRTIRDEAVRLYEQGHFDTTSRPESDAYYDIGFRTFYKYGWSKFYLTWYGTTLASAQALCPKTLEILRQVPTVNGAMLSLLPVGSQLTRHLDPLACSLRYHLGLATPNSEQCFINVDGTVHVWRDGVPFMFDETYLHFARNEADQYRLILMCDIDRPLHGPGRIANALYKALARLTVVPNRDGDKRGLVNRVFAGLAPILKRTKLLKQSHRTLYLVVKHSVNLSLLIGALALIVGALTLVHWLTQGLV